MDTISYPMYMVDELAKETKVWLGRKRIKTQQGEIMIVNRGKCNRETEKDGLILRNHQ